MLSPLAASAAPSIALDKYSSADEQVTSISQFSDVKPTDWAYQALSALVEKYGCVAGYPNGTDGGGKAMTRYEAAALLNACLDRVTEVTDELKKLMKEFEKELAVLKGRVDGLEARVGVLEANQFSTTTKLKGIATFVLGGNSFGGNSSVLVTNAQTNFGATTFNYDVRLNFDTSFSGKDLLRTTLRAGNFRDSGFTSSNTVTPLANLDAAFEENCGTGVDCGDVVAINRLFYRFPIGSSFTAMVGGRMRQDDGLAVKPSVYTADKILKIWDFNGAPGAYSQVLGAGGGLWWKQPGKTGFSFGGVYVSANGDAGAPNSDGCSSYNGDCGGIGNSASQQTGTLQLAYTGKGWNITGAYTYNSAGVNIAGTPLSQALLPNVYNGNGSGRVNSWSVAGYWQPVDNGWFPSISAGWGYNDYQYGGTVESTTLLVDSAASQSWYVGLNWRDLFAKGNALGFAVGQPTFITSLTGLDGGDIDTNDSNYAFEVYYKFQVTDNIAVTPSLFWLSRPRGALSAADSSVKAVINDPSFSNGSDLKTLGGLIQTTFRF
ncbi:MAG: iron uptake porin [Cyanobium sp.]